MFFFFKDTATTEIYTLSLHDALPISGRCRGTPAASRRRDGPRPWRNGAPAGRRGQRTSVPDGGSRTAVPGAADRKSTRLNSSHANISYAVFCLKKKNKYTTATCYCNH